MPTTPRKSSLGAQRRGSTKPHIPYRGDNVEVGKKTGIAVQRVERKSDGFEPFEELMQQADKRTPPQRKDKRRKQSLPAMDEEDEDGEMSMEVESVFIAFCSRGYVLRQLQVLWSNILPIRVRQQPLAI